MPWTTIIKSRREWETIPNLHDYENIRTHFTWEQARQDLEGLPRDQGLNIAHEAVARHAHGARASHLAIRWIGKNGTVENYSYRLIESPAPGRASRVFGAVWPPA